MTFMSYDVQRHITHEVCVQRIISRGQISFDPAIVISYSRLIFFSMQNILVLIMFLQNGGSS